MTIDITAGVGVSERSLGRLHTLTAEWEGRTKRIAELQAALKVEEVRVKELEDRDIPTAMDEVGIANFRTTTGAEVEVKQIVSGTVPTVGGIERAKPAERTILEKRREFSLGWIESHGHGGIIKTEVALTFGKGQLDDAMRATKLLRDVGFLPTMERNVHPSTFVAWVKELLQAGKQLPTEEMGLYVGPRAIIRLPK